MHLVLLACMVATQSLGSAFPSGHTGAETTNCQTNPDSSSINSFLWTIKRNPPSYFFGTIHVPYTKVWHHIPNNVKAAFKKANKVFFELDLTNSYTLSSLANCQMLPKGETLDMILPESLYHRLENHLEYIRMMLPTWIGKDTRGREAYTDYLFKIITGNWKRKRPVWVMLMVNSLTENDIRTRGIPVLDLFLAKEAVRLEKETGAVETVEEQCLPLNGLNYSQVLFALNQTLWQHESYRQGKGRTPHTTDELIHHYNCGDLDAVMFNHDTAQVPNLVNTSISQDGIATAKDIDFYFWEQLIYKRNLRMAHRVVQFFHDNPNSSFFFAFGAGHFLGNQTVLDHLRRWGYEIEHTPPSNEEDPGEFSDDYRERNPVLHMSADFPVSSIIINGNLNGNLDPFYRRKNKHRHRHGNKNGNKKKRMRDRNKSTQSMQKKPLFNDLWVRLEATSFGPNAYFRRMKKSTTVSPVPAALSGAATWWHEGILQTLCLFTASVTVHLTLDAQL